MGKTPKHHITLLGLDCQIQAHTRWIPLGTAKGKCGNPTRASCMNSS
jgi:hypothetical protein